MTTQELHIQLDILLQKVSSNWNQNLLPQEKDFFINREVTKFIKQRSNPLSNLKKLGAFDTIKRIKDLDALLTTTTLPVLGSDTQEPYIVLPLNLFGYISSGVNVAASCASKVYTKGDVATNYCYLSKSRYPGIGIDYITKIDITYSKDGDDILTTLFNYTDIPSDYLSQDNIAEYKKEFIYNNAISSLIFKNLPKDITYTYNTNKGRFEFYSKYPITLDFTTSIGGIQIADEVRTIEEGYTNLPHRSPIEIKDEEFKEVVRGSFLSRSKGKSFNGYLHSDKILIEPIATVLMSEVVITYYCKPTKIDLLLNIHSELPNEVLDEVLSNAAQSIMSVIGADNYEQYMKENLLIE